ncbi:hypothetical protein BH20ACT5_BH20ACT5_07880 [soil metagenome]
MTVPTFLVAGAARSGTTALIEGLRSHPRVFVTQPKEPHYFALHGEPACFTGPGDAATINRVAVTDRAGYLGLYPEGHDYLALGDGSVSTLHYAEHAAPEILRINPELRVVLLLRDPVDRAFSSYQYLRGRGFEPHEDFLTAVAEEPSRRQEGWHHLWHYTAMSRYADGLETLRGALGPDRVGVWFYDDFDRDPDAVFAAVLRFIGVPVEPGYTGAVTRVNVSGASRAAPIHRSIQWITRNEVLRRLVKRLTSYRFREFVRRSAVRPTAVPAAARRALDPLFADDLRRLARLVDGPTPAWLPTRSAADPSGPA